MRMSQDWKDDLALSATYIERTGCTMAVVYGCTDEQKINIVDRLKRAGNSIAHPLLIVGIFVELNRKRFSSLILELVSTFVLRTEAFGNEGRFWRQILNSEGERPGDLLQIYNDSRSRMRALLVAKYQLSKIIAHCTELMAEARLVGEPRAYQSYKAEEENAEDGRMAVLEHTDRQIRERLGEILEEYDRHIEDCKMVQQDLFVATKMVSLQSAKHNEIASPLTNRRA